MSSWIQSVFVAAFLLFWSQTSSKKLVGNATFLQGQHQDSIKRQLLRLTAEAYTPGVPGYYPKHTCMGVRAQS